MFSSLVFSLIRFVYLLSFLEITSSGLVPVHELRATNDTVFSKGNTLKQFMNSPTRISKVSNDNNSNLVSGIFKIESPTGKPISGMKLSLVHGLDISKNDNCWKNHLSSRKSEWETDKNGTANIPIKANDFFIIKGSKRPIYQDLYIYGYAGETDFYYTTLLGTKLEAEILAKSIDVPYNESRGYIVIGLDDMTDIRKGLIPSNLEPAVGASVELKGLHEDEGGKKMNGSDPIIFNPLPTKGNQIVEHGSSFVTFPNYEANIPGQCNVTPPPSSRCLLSPGFYHQGDKTLHKMPIYAFPDAITVVSYICL